MAIITSGTTACHYRCSRRRCATHIRRPAFQCVSIHHPFLLCMCALCALMCVCVCAVHQRNTRSRPYRTVFGFFSHTHTIHPIFDSHTHTCKDARALVHRRSNAPRLGLVCIDSPSVHFQPTSGSWVLNHSIPPLNVNHKNNIKLCVEFARFCRHFFARCVYQP